MVSQNDSILYVCKLDRHLKDCLSLCLSPMHQDKNNSCASSKIRVENKKTTYHALTEFVSVMCLLSVVIGNKDFIGGVTSTFTPVDTPVSVCQVKSYAGKNVIIKVTRKSLMRC